MATTWFGGTAVILKNEICEGGNREKFLFLRVRIDLLGVEIKQVVIFLHLGLLNISICDSEVLWLFLSYWLGRGSENVQRRVIFMVFSVPFFPTSNWKLGNRNVPPRSLFSRGLFNVIRQLASHDHAIKKHRQILLLASWCVFQRMGPLLTWVLVSFLFDKRTPITLFDCPVPRERKS